MKAVILPFAPPSSQRRDGVAVLPAVHGSGGRTYTCDPIHHRIEVVDESGQTLFWFGGHGPLRGQLNTPSDVVIVPLNPHEPVAAETAILAVADRGNNRVQFFELDGQPLRAANARPERPGKVWSSRSGWPFFRLATSPRIVAPVRLEWRPPFLDVTGETGAIVRVQMPAAVLPEFSDWLRIANQVELRQSLNHFLLDPYRDEIPASCLQRIAERLKPASPASPAGLDTLYGRTA